MEDPIQVYADADVRKYIEREHRRTGRSKSKIANDRLRKGYHVTGSVADGVTPLFGQGLFFAGIVLIALSELVYGTGLTILGGGVVWGAVVDKHLKNGSDSLREAFMRSIGG